MILRYFQFDSAFGPDTYYAGEPFAGSRQDDSYYGGDSYVVIAIIIRKPER